MSDQPTPETDKSERMAYAQEYMVPTEFARRLERERDEARELVKAYQEYAKLLGDEINDTVAVAYVHGWRSNRYEEGKVLRDKIKRLEESK